MTRVLGPGGTRTEGGDRNPSEENVTPWAWRSSLSEGCGRALEEAFFCRDTSEVARELLGACLRSTVQGEEVLGVVVETEAYVGPHDPASHAAHPIGRTPRNRSMFGPAGRAYVYQSYGIHWCLNVVTEAEGFPAAVLIRGLDVFRGNSVARHRRGGKEPLGAGPGRLCQAMGVTGALDGHDLGSAPLQLLEGWKVPRELMGVSGRVGIRNAADWPLRFYLLGHPQVSRGPRVADTPPSAASETPGEDHRHGAETVKTQRSRIRHD